MDGESDLGELAAKFAAHGGGKVSQELSTDLALEIVLNEIVEQACLATGASGAAIVLQRDGEWVCRASAGGNAPQLGARLDTATGLTGACVKTRAVQRCDDAQADLRADREACRVLGVRSVMVFPLQQQGELVGVFEVFSSEPSAFGERDERTMEALLQRVLKNLARAAEPLSAAVEPAEVAHPIEKSLAVMSSIATPRANREGANREDENRKDATKAGANKEGANEEDAATVAVYDPASEPVQEPASEAASGRSIHLITWALGVAVLAYAVLLTVLISQRLIGHKVAGHAGGGNQPGAAGREVSGVAASVSAPSPGSSSLNSSATRAASVAGAAGAVHAANSSPPPGSLLVYENGKEVFRMLPAGDPSEAAKATPPILNLPAQAAEGSLLHRVEPDYPEAARQQMIQGAVVLDVRVGQDGGVRDVTLVSGPPLLTQAASDAVKQWQFKPRLVSGRPVEMQTRITLDFRLPR
jgi:TonB family protein